MEPSIGIFLHYLMLTQNPAVPIHTPTTVSDALSEKYYPSLNGLRGISIIMVVLMHLSLSGNYFYLTIFNGGLGVGIFFVLSGFLITTLCLKEQKQTGTLLLKDFYVRRLLRIFPVAYLYILVVFLLNYFYHSPAAWFQYAGAICYILNFSYFRKNQNAPELNHMWSLAVEEQFYIIFPFILKKSYKAFFWSIIFIVVILPLICCVQEMYKPLSNGVLYYFTHYFIKFQSIAVGCLLSMLAFDKKLNFKWLLQYKLTGNLIAIFLILYLGFDQFYSVKSMFINLIISVLVAYIIITNIIPSTDFIYKFLNNRFLSLLGVLSYSVYIWQQMFVFGSSKWPHWLVTYPSNLIFIIIVPCLSYFFYEKYFLKLKTRFSKLKIA